MGMVMTWDSNEFISLKIKMIKKGDSLNNSGEYKIIISSYILEFEYLNNF